MALVLECDGCEQKLDSDAAKKFGRIEPVYYCQRCTRKWEFYLELEKEIRIELLEKFVVWRKDAQEQTDLKRFPDA